MKKANTIIVGAGLSGLYTALLIHPNKKVVLLVKDTLQESNSWLAQGGIAAEMNAEKAVLETHMRDTVDAGSHINNPEAVKILVNEAQENIEQLIAFNVMFDRDQYGNLKTTREGGHTASRVLHSGGDATGRDILKALQHEVKSRLNIEIIEETMAYDFLIENDVVIGVKTINTSNTINFMTAENIILATGGIGSIYSHTTNAFVATGDGIAIASKNNLVIEKMAFIQFHPTALYSLNTRSRQKFLLSEALRGEGALLRNSLGDAFMGKYHPLKDLAPRDIVSQAIYREMYDTWTDHVYLDTRHLDKSYLETRFPTIYKQLLLHGFNLGEDLIPIAPVQHFVIGGIYTDLNGQTSMPHVYAVGENASTGVHGANRLASNSLLECVVFGKRIANNINNKKERTVNYEGINEEYASYNYNYGPIRKKLGLIMEEHVGVIRNEIGLKTAKVMVANLINTLKRYPNSTVRYYETLNMVIVASLIIEDALSRKNSIGCHYRLN